MDADALLEDLDESQREAVTSELAPLAILAGPGSGKTRVLTRRIAWRVATGRAEAAHVLAVTFTRKAAGELRRRLAEYGVPGGVTAGTLHSIALAQLRRLAEDHHQDPPVLLERKARLLVPIIGGRGSQAALAAADVAGEIEWAKARLVRPSEFEAAADRAGRSLPRPAAELASIYERYEREKKKRGLADFDDLLLRCAHALESDPEFAATQRWRFRHLFVDEFQDVSPAQLRLVRAWLGERDDICVVGDPDQAIYAFTGADPTFLVGFSRVLPGGHVVRLGCNYRSTPQIVEAAEALLADGSRQARPTRRATRDAGPAPIVTQYESDTAEATGVAAGLRAAHAAGVPWSGLAVLYRTNAQSAAFEEALTKAGVPFRFRGDARFLDRPEVRATLDALRRAVRERPDTSIADHLVALRPADGDADEKAQHVDALARLAREHADLEGDGAGVDGFLAFLGMALRGDQSIGNEGGDGVELLTFHRAKGLEFDTVFVTGLERGYVPIAHAEDPEDRAEERRLLYVALTRAERVLQCSHASQRVLGGRTVNRVASPWLAVLTGTEVPRAEARPARNGTTPIDEARSRLAKARPDEAATLAPADAGLFADLVDWRRNLARASGVPAYVIFHDTTLRAVASTRPSDPNALLGVPGVGPVKVQRHGDAILELVRRHAS